jgi:uncharacterized phiE125 gp8 family phage protein
MGSVFKVLTPIATEPIALPDAKAYLRVDFGDDDGVIAGLITRARSYAETVTGRALASQQIQQIDTIARPDGGVLSGPIKQGPNWYVYNEQLGANPFGPAQYYHDLSMPPIQATQPISVQTKITAFDAWTDFALTTNTDGSATFWVDDTSEPARMYFQDPITANFWKFVYWTGYDTTYSYQAAPDLLQAVYELVAFWYQNREAQDLPQAIINKLLAKRVSWI